MTPEEQARVLTNELDQMFRQHTNIKDVEYCIAAALRAARAEALKKAAEDVQEAFNRAEQKAPVTTSIVKAVIAFLNEQAERESAS